MGEPAVQLPLVRIDARAHTVTVGGRPVHLRRLLFRMLVYLAQHAGDVVTVEDLAADVWWSANTAPVTSTIQQHIAELRRALALGGSDVCYVATVTRVGYRLDPAAVDPRSVLNLRSTVVVQVDGAAFVDALEALSERLARVEAALDAGVRGAP